MNLNIASWKPFKLGKIFNVKYGVNLELNACVESSEEGCINFVSRTESNNGVSSKILPLDDVSPQPAGLISLAGGGSALSTFYQNKEFYSGRDLYTLETVAPVSLETKMFLITVITQNKFRYSYGRQVNKTLPYIELLLPVCRNSDGSFSIDPSHHFSDDGFIPDWQFMEDYIKSLHYKPITTQNERNNSTISANEWKEFRLEEIFNLRGGFYNKKPEHSSEGSFPFLGSTENNNGVTEYYNLDDIFVWDKVGGQDNTFDKKIFDGNCIAVTVNGSVCNAFYQKEKFTCSHDITALYLIGHDMNQYIALFLCTIIMMDKYRWSYGRKPHDVKKFGQSLIKLPVDSDGNPDWQYMEDYIKGLPFGDRI